MTPSSWLRKLFGPRATGSSLPRRGSQRKQAAKRHRLEVEQLETRVVPAVITVNSLADGTLANLAGDGQVSLREAVQAANTDSSVDGSVAGSGADSIIFDPSLAGQTITLTQNDSNLAFGPTALVITTEVAIDGAADGITISGNNTHRVFVVASTGTLTLHALTVTGGNAQGGDGGDVIGASGAGGGGGAGLGGAVLNAGTLNLVDSTLTANTAAGGSGGNGGTGGITGAAGGGSSAFPGGNFVGGGPNSAGGGGGGIGGTGGTNIGGTGGAGGANEFGVPTSAGANGTAGGGGGGAGSNGVSGSGVALSSGGLGGGGGGSASGGSAGGFGSGGGGGLFFPGRGGNGGFGGGGGGSGFGTEGSGGFGGGTGGTGSIGMGGGGGAGLGGAVFNYGGTVTIVNSTLSGNTALGGNGGTGSGDGLTAGNGSGLGGAVFSRNGTVTIVNSTISSNTAALGGRGVYLLGDGASAMATLNNTIVGQANNTVSDFVAATINTGTVSAGGSNNLIRSQIGFTGSFSTADPLLGSLADNGGPTLSLALLQGSPAIDAGSNALAVDSQNQALTTDQRGTGFLRQDGAAVDIGAYELQPVNDPPVNTVPGAQTTVEGTDLVFSTATGNPIQISDIDAGTSAVKVTLSTNLGRLSLAQLDNLTFSTGTGTADTVMVFTGTIADINAALNGLKLSTPDNGSAVVQITTDDQGNTGSGGALTHTDTVAVTMKNVAPAVTISGPAAGVRGQVLSYSAAVSDKGANDNPTATWSVKQGTALIASGVGTDASFIPATTGTYTVAFVAADKDGSKTTATKPVTVSGILLSEGTLYIGGSASSDIIRVRPSNASGNLKVTINSAVRGPFKPTNQIVIYGQAGDDNIALGSQIISGQTVRVTIPAIISGDKGNDIISVSGSTANNALIGGAGNDNLTAASGRDLLIGGSGRDTLLAGVGEDIVIGGKTAYADETSRRINMAALNAIMSEWGRTTGAGIDYNSRVNTISQSSFSHPLNAATVLDDGKADTLRGQGNLDWFFASTTGPEKDTTNATLEEIVTILD